MRRPNAIARARSDQPAGQVKVSASPSLVQNSAQQLGPVQPQHSVMHAHCGGKHAGGSSMHSAVGWVPEVIAQYSMPSTQNDGPHANAPLGSSHSPRNERSTPVDAASHAEG